MLGRPPKSPLFPYTPPFRSPAVVRRRPGSSRPTAPRAPGKRTAPAPPAVPPRDTRRRPEDGWAGSYGAPALNDPNENDHDRDHQQQVNETAELVRRNESQQPQNDENDRQRHHKRSPPLGSRRQRLADDPF